MDFGCSSFNSLNKVFLYLDTLRPLSTVLVFWVYRDDPDTVIYHWFIRSSGRTRPKYTIPCVFLGRLSGLINVCAARFAIVVEDVDGNWDNTLFAGYE